MSRGVMGSMNCDGYTLERFTSDGGLTWQADCSCGWTSILAPATDPEIAAAQLYTHAGTYGWASEEAA